jgi:PilZ domain-containing protein
MAGQGSEPPKAWERLPERQALPAPGTRIRVSVGWGVDPREPIRAHQVPSTVEDVVPAGRNPAREPARLLVDAPSFRGDLTAPFPGTHCVVGWMSERGPCELAAAFEAVTHAGGASIWQLQVTGPTLLAQRRSFYRLPLTVPVTVALPVTDPRLVARPTLAELRGFTADVSEGGVRCLLAVQLPATSSPRGWQVAVAIELPDSKLALPGSVVRAIPGEVRPAAGRAGYSAAEMAIRWDPDEHGDAIRKALFDQQLRQRRIGV